MRINQIGGEKKEGVLQIHWEPTRPPEVAKHLQYLRVDQQFGHSLGQDPKKKRVCSVNDFWDTALVFGEKNAHFHSAPARHSWMAGLLQRASTFILGGLEPGE